MDSMASLPPTPADYWSGLRARLQASGITVTALAREASMALSQLSRAMHKCIDPRLSSVRKLEVAFQSLLNRKAGPA